MSFLARTLAHRLALTNRHQRRLERKAKGPDLDLKGPGAAEIDEAFSAEFTAVNLEDAWEASFELLGLTTRAGSLTKKADFTLKPAFIQSSSVKSWKQQVTTTKRAPLEPLLVGIKSKSPQGDG